MRKSMVVVVVGAAVFAIWHWRSTSPPSANQVEPLLKAYLLSGASGRHWSSSMMSLSVSFRVSLEAGPFMQITRRHAIRVTAQ
jgi:hypothetical protein